MTLHPRRRFCTPEQYLEFEERNDTRHEYFQGETFLMSGGSLEHNDIICNLVTELRIGLRGKPCKAYCQDLRLWVEQYQLFTYPDILVVCGPPRLLPGRRDTVSDATVLVEVLSRSTKDYDAGDKFKFYRALSSFKDYLLVSQDEFRVEHHGRQESNQWLMTEHTTSDAVLDLPSIGLKLSLKSIYDGVSFEQTGPAL